MKKYPYTLFISLVIAVLSLMPVPETPLNEINFIDKWTHLLMYFGQTSAFWLDYCRQRGLRLFCSKAPFFVPRSLQVELMNRKHLLWGGLAFPIFWGGLMELLQAYCTNHMRSGDWVDWVADALGSVIGYGFCALLVGLFFKRK